MLKRFLPFLMLLPTIGAWAEDDMTDLRLYSPFSEAPFQETTSVYKQLEGECFANSKDSPQKRAFTCQSEHKLFHTCFARKYGDQDTLVCLNSPWQKKVTELHLNLPLPELKPPMLDMSRATPWALELDNNTLCKKAHQLTDAEYQCNDGAVLSLPIYRCSPKWSIARTDAISKALQTTKIKRAWF